MPFPLLVPVAYGLAGLIGGAGVGAAVVGAGDLLTAKDKVARAKQRHAQAVAELEAARLASAHMLEALGHARLQAAGHSLQRFAKVMRRLGAQAQAKQRHHAHQNLPVLTASDLQRFEHEGHAAVALLKGAAQGASAGAALAAGVGGLATTFGTTAGGVAIASLKGAAASNATLAFLGGGSLASGGGGVAAGTAVLGGLAAAPLLCIAGFALATHAEKELTAACEYEADVERKVAGLQQMCVVLSAVDARAHELCDLTHRVAQRLDAVVTRLESNRRWAGLSLKPASEADIGTAWAMASALSRLLDVQLMDEAGHVTAESARVSRDIQGVINA